MTLAVVILAAGTGSELHLIEPLGFDMSEAKLRRAGLDYHDLASVTGLGIAHPSVEPKTARSARSARPIHWQSVTADNSAAMSDGPPAGRQGPIPGLSPDRRRWHYAGRPPSDQR